MYDNHAPAKVKALPHTKLRKIQNLQRDYLTIGSLGTDVARRLPDKVAEWLCREALKLPAISPATLPSVASLIALIVIDAYHDDMEEAARKKARKCK